MAASVLENLLRPLAVESFIKDVWGKRPIHLDGVQDRLVEIFSLERFRALMAKLPDTPSGGEGTTVFATFDRAWGQTSDPIPDIRVAPQAAEAAFAAGATVCVDALHRSVPELAQICRAVAAELGYPGPVGMKAYWSPDGCGFKTHIDARISTTLQLDGTKRWRFSTVPAVAWPPASAVLENGKLRYIARKKSGSWAYHHAPRVDWELEMAPASLDGWQEAVLQPGDVLCLPAGVWHAAEARGQSFAINLYIDPVPLGRFLGDALVAKMNERPSWRFVPPLLADHGVRGGVSQDVVSRLEARLDEAIEQLSEWRRDPRALLESWAAIFQSAEEPAKGPPCALTDASELSLSDTILVLSAPADPDCVVFANGNEIRASGAAGRVLHEVLGARRFRAGDLAPSGVPLDETKRTLAALVDAGVLVVV